jgi:hypothetical protein
MTGKYQEKSISSLPSDLAQELASQSCNLDLGNTSLIDSDSMLIPDDTP